MVFKYGTDLVIVHVLIFLVFLSLNYAFMLMNSTGDYFVSKTSGIIDALYYTTATHTTTGFGDVVPVATTTKLISTAHMMSVFMFTVGIMSLHLYGV
jgi:hypothetical protein